MIARTYFWYNFWGGGTTPFLIDRDFAPRVLSAQWQGYLGKTAMVRS